LVVGAEAGAAAGLTALPGGFVALAGMAVFAGALLAGCSCAQAGSSPSKQLKVHVAR
jgi:hypothetical protein